MKAHNATAQQILDRAEHLTQTRGFNAFSYRDIQQEVGIKTSSIHYYFPTKQDLAYAMAERYVDRFDGLLRELKAKHRPGLKRLEALKAVYTKVLSEGKFCICGMLASDLAALPESAKVKLQEFFTMNERWIAEAVEDAQKAKQLRVNLDPKRAAALFFAVLEGGMLIARTQCHPKFLEQVIEQLIEQMQE